MHFSLDVIWSAISGFIKSLHIVVQAIWPKGDRSGADKTINYIKLLEK